MSIHTTIPALLLSAASLLMVGCSSGDHPDVGRVHGKVTLNGEPMEGVVVSFEPAEGGRGSWALTDAEGQYELNYNANTRGTRTGDNLVRLSKQKPVIRDDNGRVTDPGFKEKFPAEYNTQSTQIVTVQGGDNEFNFDVVSD
ncbi:carboxypeptidase regulatory-like domain-containing protein [Bremerella cremea]|uniref:carboxypeptidase regulatory-like domain-containing protein n=1 Tax=Bremerella cremea TaxID=1031537 RepID=UPI0031F04AD0